MTMHLPKLRCPAPRCCCAVAAPLAPAQATKIERVVSPGGIEAWLVRDPTVPLIAMDFAFLGGANQDPEDKPGVGLSDRRAARRRRRRARRQGVPAAPRGERGRAALLVRPRPFPAARSACCATAWTRASTCCGWR